MTGVISMGGTISGVMRQALVLNLTLVEYAAKLRHMHMSHSTHSHQS